MRVPRLGALRFQEAKPVLARHHVEQGATFTAEGRPVPERSEAGRKAKDGERTEPASGPSVGEGEGGGGEAGQDEGDGSLGEGAEQGAHRGDPDRPARATREGERPAGEHDRERGRERHVDTRTGGSARPLEGRREHERRGQARRGAVGRARRRPGREHGGRCEDCRREPERQLGLLRQRVERDGRAPVVERRLARGLTIGPHRHEPRPGTEHLLHDEPLAGFAPCVEGDAAGAGQIECSGKRYQEERLAAGTHDG